MDYSRIDTAKLKAAVAKAVKKCEEADEILAPFLEVLADHERATIPRPPEGFALQARKAVEEANSQPAFAKMAGFDGGAVIEDLNNVDALVALERAHETLGRKIADARLAWTAEAYVPTLDLYYLAKRKADSDGNVQPIVDAIAPMFASRRGKKKPAPTPAK